VSVNKKGFIAGSLVLSAAVLVACGGDVAPTPVAAAATVVAASPANAAAATVVLQTVATAASPATFSAGVPALGTTASTTLAVSNTTATATTPSGATVSGPAFSLASGGKTASGVLTFGSCVFTVSASTFEATHPMAVGKQVTVTPCQASLATNGVTADGAAKPVASTLTLGSVTSVVNTVQAVVSTTGSVSLVSSTGATVQVGTAVVVTPTGSTGGGG